MISLNLGKFGKVRINSPTPLELVALALVLVFLLYIASRWWR
jgi:hypothetical protein